ncbi:glycosyltransferase [Paraflavisolibacter sp. H34]|uniref:glycosyltransferase family 2 protein n=1 Tax=Huijunlia imazamoxiresistens TaxID=3127457 RepID=UPI00301732D4
MNGPLVSIIMPAYNVEKYVRETIETIFNQTYTNWELLVADDASTDGTRRILDSYTDPRIRCFHNEKNLKVLKTRNKLLPHAKGELIAFMDADDTNHPQRLEKQVARFAQKPNLGFCGTWVQAMDESGTAIRVNSKPVTNEEIKEGMKKFNPIGEATILVPKKVLDEVGYFREYFDGLPCQVYDLAYLISEKYECENIPEVLYYYRMNPNSNSKKIDPRRIVTYDLVQYLGKQRQQKGTDDIMDNRLDLLNRKMEELLQPYQNDPSLVYRYYAGSFMYSKLYDKAIQASIDAIKVSPGKVVNYRTLFYCFRKKIQTKFT